MALPPSRPSEWAAVVPNSGDPACTIVTKLIQHTRLSSDLIAWLMNDDGEPTEDLLDWIGTTASGLAAPTGLSATTDRTSDITVTWASVSGALSYDVYRGSTATTSEMTLVANDQSGTTYVDVGVAGEDISYWYSIRAKNSTLISDYSSAVSGKSPASSSASDPVYYDNREPASPLTITIPSGKTSMDVVLIGPGGNGGGQIQGFVPAAGTLEPGGGGSSGSLYYVTAITVAAGEQYVLAPGAPGSNSIIYLSSDSTKNAYATKGNNGENDQIGTGGGVPGAAPSFAGSKTFATGTVSTSTVGNAGSGSSGGAALSITVGGFVLTAGAGGTGTLGATGSAGAYGYVWVKLT